MAAGDVDCSIIPLSGKYAALFDGIDDYIIIPNTLPFYRTAKKSFSFSIWAFRYAQAGGEAIQALISLEGSCGYIRLNFQTANGVLSLYWNDTGGNHNINSDIAPYYTWHNFTVTFDGTTFTLYKNGVLVGNDTATEVSLSPITLNFLGCRSDVAPMQYFFKGGIGLTKIWDRALTSAEVEDDFEGRPVDTNLVAKYTFEDYNDHHGSYNLTNSGSRLIFSDKSTALIFKGLRKTANDKYLITDSPGGIITAHIEEA